MLIKSDIFRIISILLNIIFYSCKIDNKIEIPHKHKQMIQWYPKHFNAIHSYKGTESKKKTKYLSTPDPIFQERNEK